MDISIYIYIWEFIYKHRNIYIYIYIYNMTRSSKKVTSLTLNNIKYLDSDNVENIVLKISDIFSDKISLILSLQNEI